GSCKLKLTTKSSEYLVYRKFFILYTKPFIGSEPLDTTFDNSDNIALSTSIMAILEITGLVESP
ncbi:hypothetical protein NL401_28045, partial [Klebsiella pneumoniae]|nr:hypothetical protein [Klebsiella pneumoniae]